MAQYGCKSFPTAKPVVCAVCFAREASSRKGSQATRRSSVSVSREWESEARGKSIKDSTDRFRLWWWRDLNSLTVIPTRFQTLHELRPKSLAVRSNVKRRACCSVRVRVINRRGFFPIAAWFLSPDRVCLSSAVTFAYLSGLDFYLQCAHFLFRIQTRSSLRSMAWTGKAQNETSP